MRPAPLRSRSQSAPRERRSPEMGGGGMECGRRRHLRSAANSQREERQLSVQQLSVQRGAPPLNGRGSDPPEAEQIAPPPLNEREWHDEWPARAPGRRARPLPTP